MLEEQTQGQESAFRKEVEEQAGSLKIGTSGEVEGDDLPKSERGFQGNVAGEIRIKHS